MKIVANIFSAFQAVCFGISTVQKNEKAIYILQGLAPAFIAVALVINGGYTAACMAVITAVANFLCIKDKLTNAVFAGTMGFIILIAFVTYKQPIDLVSLLAATEGIAVKKYYKTAKYIHLGMSLNCAFYAVTDMYFRLIPSSICDIAFTVSSLVSFIRLSKQDRKYLTLSEN